MKFKNFIPLVAILCLVLIFFLLYKKNNTVNSKTKNDLIVGIIAGYAPFAILDNDGNIEGFDIDIARIIAKKLNKNLVLQDMSLSALLVALQQNKIDMVLTGLSITEERLKKIAMIHYQGEPVTTYPLVFWKEVPQDVSSIEDLITNKNVTICVEPGSTQEKFLLQFPSLTLCQSGAISEIILNLKYQKAQAALLDPDVYPTFKKQTPELTEINVPLPKAFQSTGVGIGINRNNDYLIKKVSTIITELKNNGTIAKLQDKWL